MVCLPTDLHFVLHFQVINKHEGQEFTVSDEKVFESYLQFCGIGLKNAQLYERSQLEVKRNQVGLCVFLAVITEAYCTVDYKVSQSKLQL